MAKNVDLTSREWRDLIFEGKNKEFGAYVLRKNSESRHTLASVYVLIGLCVVAGLIYAWSLYSDYQAEQAAIEAKQRAEQMSQAQLAQMEEVPEEEEEIEEQKFEQPEIEVPQEVLATVQVTQIAIVDAEEVKNEIMDQEAQQEDNTARGVVNQEGSDDADKFQAMAEVVVVKEPEPEPVKEPEVIVKAKGTITDVADKKLTVDVNGDKVTVSIDGDTKIASGYTPEKGDTVEIQYGKSELKLKEIKLLDRPAPEASAEGGGESAIGFLLGARVKDFFA